MMTRGLVAAALTVPLLVTAPAAAAPSAQHVSLPVEQAIGRLKVADEDRTGYQRSSFKHWIDEDGDGCHTRAEVLLQEATEAPQQGSGCKLTGGKWTSYYDETEFTDAGKLDIDHVVPLAEAWDSGASAWDADQRMRYANDLGSERSLVAVSARSNRQKGDKDPTDWWVPATGASCQYLSDWVATKTRWQLAIDAAEKRALAEHAAECADTVVETDLAE